MYRPFLALSSFLTFLFLFSSSVFASGMVISSSQNSLNTNDEFNVGVSFTINTGDGTSYYLRGVFYKEGTSQYCGYTWNGNNWYNGPYSNNGWEQLLPVTIYQSSWSGQLKAKVDSSDSGCQSSGEYKFRVQRYTTGGSSSFDDQNILTVNLTIPTPTPTSQPTPTPTKAPTPTPTVKAVATSTPTPLLIKTTEEHTNTSQKINGNGEVLGVSSGKKSQSPSPTDEPTPEVLVKDESTGSAMFSPAVFLIGGLGVITVGCGILLFREWRKQKGEGIV